MGETALMVRREACSFSGPFCVLDLDPGFWAKIAKIGHALEEIGQKAKKMVCVCLVFICGEPTYRMGFDTSKSNV